MARIIDQDPHVLYFVRNPISKRIKIGIARNHLSRLNQLKKEYGCDQLYIEHFIGYPNRDAVFAAEDHWHVQMKGRNKRFALLSKKGKYAEKTEWFNMSVAEVSLVVEKIYASRVTPFGYFFGGLLIKLPVKVGK